MMDIKALMITKVSGEEVLLMDEHGATCTIQKAWIAKLFPNQNFVGNVLALVLQDAPEGYAIVEVTIAPADLAELIVRSILFLNLEKLKNLLHIFGCMFEQFQFCGSYYEVVVKHAFLPLAHETLHLERDTDIVSIVKRKFQQVSAILSRELQNFA